VSTLVELLPHDLAVLAALETIGKPVGFAAAPDGALEAVRARTGPDYMVLYPLNSVRDGSLADPWMDADLVYQVTCVGRLAAGVRWLTDRIEPALAGVSIAGRAVVQVTPEDGGQVRTDFDLTPPVFIATPRYRITSVPE
jgi:hypothetical protein